MSEIDREAINSIILGREDVEIRSRFIDVYGEPLEIFVDHMVVAFAEWALLDSLITKDEPSAHVSALVYGALHTHTVAMKLLLEGLFVPAGNSQRYVLESIATALLVSKPSLHILDRYARGNYSTSKAVRDVARHAGALHLNRDALTTLKQQANFYDRCSHPTLFSSASLVSFSPPNYQTVLGGHFDTGKSFAYEMEIKSRVSLASIFPNFIYAVQRNYLDHMYENAKKRTEAIIFSSLVQRAHRVRARMARCSTRGPLRGGESGSTGRAAGVARRATPFRAGKMPARKARPRLTDLPGMDARQAPSGVAFLLGYFLFGHVYGSETWVTDVPGHGLHLTADF